MLGRPSIPNKLKSHSTSTSVDPKPIRRCPAIWSPLKLCGQPFQLSRHPFKLTVHRFQLSGRPLQLFGRPSCEHSKRTPACICTLRAHSGLHGRTSDAFCLAWAHSRRILGALRSHSWAGSRREGAEAFPEVTISSRQFAYFCFATVIAPKRLHLHDCTPYGCTPTPTPSTATPRGCSPYSCSPPACTPYNCTPCSCNPHS